MEKSQNPPPYTPSQPGFNPPPHVYPNLPQDSSSYPQPPQHQTVIVTHTVPQALGPVPVSTSCPSCHAQITTSVQTEATTKTHLFALLLCLFGCWPCCCVPYCMDSCQSQNHYCPNCRAYLGKYDN